MRQSGPTRGFTLIELMIVIAIIAVIAAIAIPGLISSQRAANERNAAGSLKTFSTAQADFRGNDRDGNRIQDFWTRDVSGLYTLCPIGSTEPIKLIEISLSGADSNPLGAAASPTSGDETVNLAFSVQSPKSTYWYVAMETDESGNAYSVVTNGLSPLDDKPWFNRTKFAILAYPESYPAGRSTFQVNEGNVIYKRTLSGSVRPAGGLIPPGVALVQAGVAGVAPLMTWPTDAELRVEYSKLD
jgi:prepilin-type N-terminal cleavage/methylation domain-containing protein